MEAASDLHVICVLSFDAPILSPIPGTLPHMMRVLPLLSRRLLDYDRAGKVLSLGMVHGTMRQNKPHNIKCARQRYLMHTAVLCLTVKQEIACTLNFDFRLFTGDRGLFIYKAPTLLTVIHTAHTEHCRVFAQTLPLPASRGDSRERARVLDPRQTPLHAQPAQGQAGEQVGAGGEPARC